MEATTASTAHKPELAGQTVVLIGGSAGIGLETARRARAEGADVILAARDPERLKRAADDVGARSTAAFDATDEAALKQFFDGLPDPIDHVLVTGPGPGYVPLLEMTADQVRHEVGDHLVLGLEVARNAAGKMRPGGTLLLMGGTGGRRIRRWPGAGIGGHRRHPTVRGHPGARARPGPGQPDRRRLRRHPPCRRRTSPRRELEARREELRRTLPIGRVVGPADVAALAVHIMANTALTGATYDIDGGQQFVA